MNTANLTQAAELEKTLDKTKVMAIVKTLDGLTIVDALNHLEKATENITTLSVVSSHNFYPDTIFISQKDPHEVDMQTTGGISLKTGSLGQDNPDSTI